MSKTRFVLAPRNLRDAIFLLGFLLFVVGLAFVLWTNDQFAFWMNGVGLGIMLARGDSIRSKS
jgi:hypothetical protein